MTDHEYDVVRHYRDAGGNLDARAAASPPNLRVLADVPNPYGPGFTAQMTYYKTASGAKVVFAAGAFGIESIIEPDKPLADPAARRTQAGSKRLLVNLWAALSSP